MLKIQELVISNVDCIGSSQSLVHLRVGTPSRAKFNRSNPKHTLFCAGFHSELYLLIKLSLLHSG